MDPDDGPLRALILIVTYNPSPPFPTKTHRLRRIKSLEEEAWARLWRSLVHKYPNSPPQQKCGLVPRSDEVVLSEHVQDPALAFGGRSKAR